MPAKVFYRSKRGEDIRIQIDSTERGSAILVIRSQPNRVCASLHNLSFEIGNQRSTNASALTIRSNYQRMKLPDVAGVLLDSADPTQHAIVVVDGDAADSIWPQRILHLFQRFHGGLPCRRTSAAHSFNEHFCNLTNRVRILTEVDDSHMTSACSLFAK